MRSFLYILFGLLITFAGNTLTRSAEFKSQPLVRRPCAILAASEHLFVANRDSGTVIVLRKDTLQPIVETKIGKRLSAAQLATADDKRRLFITDESASELIVVKILNETEPEFSLPMRFPVPRAPVSVIPPGRHHPGCVASLWARQITLFDDVQATGLSSRLTIDLPFAPRRMIVSPDKKWLIVADSFGGRLATVDLLTRTIHCVQTIPGHNIRGLAWNHDGTELQIAHQMLTTFQPTTREHVFWGNVLTNILRSISLQQLTVTSERAAQRRLIHGSLIPMGEQGNAAGDPGPVYTTSSGQTVVSLSGVNEVAVQQKPNRPFVRRAVQTRPTHFAVDATSQRAWVVNTFSDSVSEINLQTAQVLRTRPIGKMRKLTSVERGEQEFYSARHSLDGWFSCHSCHTDGHSCGLTNDNLGDNNFGAPRRVLSLLGTAQTGPWAWNGSRSTLEEQVRKSFAETMHRANRQRLTDDTVTDLVAYLKSLPPPPPLASARQMSGRRKQHVQIKKGKEIFNTAGCVNCHQPPTYTSNDLFDVGFRDPNGATQFNPPSLRGVSQRDSLLHDGRATSLTELLQKYQHGIPRTLDDSQQRLLLDFLKSI